MLNLKRQLHAIYAISALGSLQIAGAAWVALLAAQGFSLVQIGVAESVFHVASLLFELPSGVISDVFGRKRSMILSQCMFLLSALIMAFAENFGLVCLSLVLNAFGYNFASGSREALGYDSLKAAGQEDRYLAHSSKEFTIYRLSSAAAMLCAGLALWLGRRRAYLLDAVVCAACLLCACRLVEVETEERQFADALPQRLLRCFRESLAFLRDSRSSLALMLWNALVGAVSMLTVFFLQAQLPKAGLPEAWLGLALFLISLGGALGAKLTTATEKLAYKPLSILCCLAVGIGVVCAKTGLPWLLCLGGFLCSCGDDHLQVRTDALLNTRVPSSQRATLISVSSLCYSLVMIALSPLAGLFFS